MTTSSRLHGSSAGMGTAPAQEDLLRLPQLMDEATSILWDADNANLVYVCPAKDSGKVLKVVVDVPMRPKDAKGLAKLGSFDAVVNVMEIGEIDARPLTQSQFRLLWTKK